MYIKVKIFYHPTILNDHILHTIDNKNPIQFVFAVITTPSSKCSIQINSFSLFKKLCLMYKVYSV